MYRILAQEPGGGLLPDWLADGPPWLQALALFLAAAAVIALGYAASLAPAFADRIRGRTAPTTTLPTQDGSTEVPVESPTTRRSVSAQDADAKMLLIDRLVAGLERSLEDAEGQVATLQRALEAVQVQLAEVRGELARVTWQRDRLLEQRLPPDRPRRDRSPET